MHWKGWGKMKLFLFPVQNIGRVSWCCIYSRFCRMYEFHFRFAWNPDSVVLLLVFTTFIGQRMLSSCTKWPKSMSPGEGGEGKRTSFFHSWHYGFCFALATFTSKHKERFRDKQHREGGMSFPHFAPSFLCTSWSKQLYAFSFSCSQLRLAQQGRDYWIAKGWLSDSQTAPPIVTRFRVKSQEVFTLYSSQALLDSFHHWALVDLVIIGKLPKLSLFSRSLCTMSCTATGTKETPWKEGGTVTGAGTPSKRSRIQNAISKSNVRPHKER